MIHSLAIVSVLKKTYVIRNEIKDLKQSELDHVHQMIRQIFCSRGRPVEQFYWTSNRNSTGRPVEIFIAFLDEISNSKTFEANLQNSSGCPVESYWTSSRI